MRNRLCVMLTCPQGSLFTSMTGYPGMLIHPLITAPISRYDLGPTAYKHQKKTVLDQGSKSHRPHYHVITPTCARLCRYCWHRPHDAARLPTQARSSGVTRLQWARVQVFQKGPLFPKKLLKNSVGQILGPPQRWARMHCTPCTPYCLSLIHISEPTRPY